MAGSVSETAFNIGHLRRTDFALVGDAITGAIPDWVTYLGGVACRLTRLVINPGTLTSPSASASPSTSPSVSASASVSPSNSPSPSVSASSSTSPSASTSPSLSASSSASPSRSPSLSTSASASPSLSPSASASPSSSRSPSASASPSAGAPSEGFDVQLVDRYGVDALQGLGVGHRAATTSVPLVFSSTSVHPSFSQDEVFTLRVGGQFAPSGRATVSVYYALGV